MYRAFLVRIWDRAETADTRASATDVNAGTTHVFADLEELVDWMKSETRGSGDSREPNGLGPKRHPV